MNIPFLTKSRIKARCEIIVKRAATGKVERYTSETEIPITTVVKRFLKRLKRQKKGG